MFRLLVPNECLKIATAKLPIIRWKKRRTTSIPLFEEEKEEAWEEERASRLKADCICAPRRVAHEDHRAAVLSWKSISMRAQWRWRSTPTRDYRLPPTGVAVRRRSWRENDSREVVRVWMQLPISHGRLQGFWIKRRFGLTQVNRSYGLEKNINIFK